MFPLPLPFPLPSAGDACGAMLGEGTLENAAAIARLADLIDGRHAEHAGRHDHALESHRTLTERLDALEARLAELDGQPAQGGAQLQDHS